MPALEPIGVVCGEGGGLWLLPVLMLLLQPRPLLPLGVATAAVAAGAPTWPCVPRSPACPRPGSNPPQCPPPLAPPARPQALKRPPLLWVTGHIHEAYGTYRVPHPAVPDGILLVGAANFYITKPQHADSAQPRAVQLPEGVVLPRTQLQPQ